MYSLALKEDAWQPMWWWWCWQQQWQWCSSVPRISGFTVYSSVFMHAACMPPPPPHPYTQWKFHGFLVNIIASFQPQVSSSF
jgi:hypothetical protein